MYLSELRALAQWCKFGDTLDDMLRDRLVCGVNEETIQRRLLAESGLTLKRPSKLLRGWKPPLGTRGKSKGSQENSRTQLDCHEA